MATEIYEQVDGLSGMYQGKELYILNPFVVVLDPKYQDEGSVVIISDGPSGEIYYVSPQARGSVAVMLRREGVMRVPLASAPTGEAVLETMLTEWRGAIAECQVFCDLISLVVLHGKAIKQSKMTIVPSDGAPEVSRLVIYELGPYLFIIEDRGPQKVLDARLALHMILWAESGALVYVGPPALDSIEPIGQELAERGLQVEGFDDPPIGTGVVKEILDKVSAVVHSLPGNSPSEAT